jgi:hypothetical protein
MTPETPAQNDVSSAATEPSRPLERLAQIEAELFCTKCGYNLHGQTVTRDARLGIFICRCPECGTFHPASQASSATSVLLGRLSVLLLLLWIGVVLYLVVGGCVALCALQYETAFEAVMSHPYQRWSPDAKAMLVLCALVAFGLGVVIAVALWHIPAKWSPWIRLIPAAAYVLAMLIRSFEDPVRERGVLPSIWMAGAVALATQWLAMAAGLRFGRGLARIVVRVIVPPKARQVLAFLWRVDGKIVPTE